jgi:dipeptidyl aminopeptidase/acylaminoacyl peptidase
MASLTPYDNPLYTSNLAGLPILVIHGTEDDNVPVWHSRQYIDLVKSWSGDASAIT